jgi:hypothetical protein
MIGSGGDQQARQDMFPTKVPDWQTQPRVGGSAIGKGSSLDVLDNPIEVELRALSVLRDRYPELSAGASVVRYAKDAVLVVSRIDLASGHEVVVGLNNGTATAHVSVSTATPGATWTAAFGTGSATGALTLAIPPVSAVVAVPSAAIPVAAPAKPALVAKADDLTSLYRLSATSAGTPVSIGFAIRRRGGTWQRVAIDGSAPYRAFLEPSRFKKRERVYGVAVARGVGGAAAVSNVVTFTPNP